jgi:hypothetical protein
VIAVGISFRDITERKEAAEKIIQHNKEVSEANKRFEVLVANTTEREKRMLELKQEVNDLLISGGKEMKYSAPKKVEDLLNKNQWLKNRRYKTCPLPFTGCIAVDAGGIPTPYSMPTLLMLLSFWIHLIFSFFGNLRYQTLLQRNIMILLIECFPASNS